MQQTRIPLHAGYKLGSLRGDTVLYAKGVIVLLPDEINATMTPMGHHLRFAVVIAALLGPTLALALAQSEPSLRIEHDAERDAMAVHASIDIAASPQIVFGVITDCNRAPKFVPNLESCRVLQKDPKGRWEVRETILNIAMLPRIRAVSRSEIEPPKRFAFHRVEGDMRISRGEWRLEPLAKGKATRVHYDALFALKYPVPRFLVESAAYRDIPALMKGVERESLHDAGR
jgi:ribosome-associated toxin RatA of RatAB toxin-antitoxin module